MRSFTTQTHQRNYQGNVVMPKSNQNRSQKRHKTLKGITITVMALAIAITSGLLGATTIHNHELKNEVQTLRIQNTQVDANTNQNSDEINENHKPKTLEIRHSDTNDAINDNTQDGEKHRTETRRRHKQKQVKPQIL